MLRPNKLTDEQHDLLLVLAPRIKAAALKAMKTLHEPRWKLNDYMQEAMFRSAELIIAGETDPDKFFLPAYQHLLRYFYGLDTRGECLIRVPRGKKPHKIIPLGNYQPRIYHSLDRLIRIQEFICDLKSCCKDDVDRFIADQLASGMPERHIADQLGLTISTIKKRKKRLFAAFKERFPDYANEK